jgi:hypothetical protein
MRIPHRSIGRLRQELVSNVVNGDVRSMTMTSYPASYLFRVRTIGPGGLSEPADATIGIIARRRAERP